MELQFRVGWNLNSSFEDLKEFLFKKGKLPSIKELKKLSVSIQGYRGESDFLYPFSDKKKSVSEIKEAISGYKYKKDKENLVLVLAYFYNTSFQDIDSSSKVYSCGVIDEYGTFYFFAMKKRDPITLTELYEIFEGKISKSFINSIMNVISITENDRKIVEKLLEKNKLYYHRILGKNGFQFTEDELKEMVKDPRFNAKNYNGTFGSDETVDIQCRRAVLLHQEACTSEIVMDMLSVIKTDREKMKFINTLSGSRLEEKFKDDPAIQVLLKLY